MAAVRLRAQMRESLVRHVPTIYTVLHTLIDVHQSYVPFWLLGVVGADLRPDSCKVNCACPSSGLDATDQKYCWPVL
jgi:hypothetical protein